MKKVGIGIIGCRACGSTFLPVFKYLDNGYLVGMMDINEEEIRFQQELYKVEGYTDLREMLKNDDIKVVIVASPTRFHAEQTIECLKAGKHVLCEKPMARTIDECDAMLSEAKKNKVILMVGHMKRFNRCFKMAKEMIERGDLGKVMELRTRWDAANFKDTHLNKLEQLGHITATAGSHLFDIARWWLGEVETVSAEVSILIEPHELDDQSVIMLRHTSGAISTHTMTYMTHKPVIEQYEIFGSKATLQISFEGRWSFTSTEPFRITLFTDEGQVVRDITPKRVGSENNLDREIKKHNQYLKELENFCECILNNKKPEVLAEDGRKAVEIINAAYLSSWKKEKIGLPLKEMPDLEKYFLKLQNIYG